MNPFTVSRERAGRYVARSADGAVIGWAACAKELFGQPLRAGQRFLEVWVEPDQRGRGAGKALYDAAFRAADRAGADSLACSVAPDDPAALAFAEHRGFRVDYRMVECELDLERFDPAPWERAVAGAEAAGIHFTTLLQGQEISGDLKKLYALDERLSADIPQWSGVMPSYAEFCAPFLSGDWSGVVIAWHGDEPVGYAASQAYADGTGYTHMLGVLRDWRSKGVALALKLLTIQWARERGLKQLASTNNAASEAILSLNRKLGYTLRPGPVYLVREGTGPVTQLKAFGKTALSLALFIGLYAWWKDWWYGAGLGAIILLHELGHCRQPAGLGGRGRAGNSAVGKRRLPGVLHPRI